MNASQKEYLTEAERQLKACAEGIDALKAKAQSAGAREKLKLYDQLEDLVIVERAAKVELAGLKDAGSDSWERRKAALEAVMKSLREGLDAS